MAISYGVSSISLVADRRSTTRLIHYAAEFAVADIKDISWNPAALAQLAIPSKQKEVIQALTEAHTSRGSDHAFDDFVVGKGLSLIILLQYWPPISVFNFQMLMFLPAGFQAWARL